MKQLNVEFLGQARRLTQTKESPLQIGERASFADVLRLLASRYPALIGPVIVPDTFELQSSYMINVNGRRVVRDLGAQPEDGQRLILMFVEAGG